MSPYGLVAPRNSIMEFYEDGAPELTNTSAQMAKMYEKFESKEAAISSGD